ncbi:hypothetical protein CSA37_06105 [Candidatus Fermentibacteria bacterium]|nr:MAG: hypothetical protein CSA37_06105 [Candidatus Fermentibacteria bacterium]
MSERFSVWIWILAAAVLGVTVWFLVSFSGSATAVSPAIPDVPAPPGDTLAVIGGYVLHETDLALIRADEGAIESWTRDQILACAALEAGLENPSVSRFVQARARQLYLRDLMTDEITLSVPVPTEEEIIVFMYSDPELYLIERHYFQIIAADSAMADSIHTRLGWGQNFQVTAQNISTGQKAGIGGDLGFATGAEMLANGLPEHIARLDGLSPVVPSSLGWHIFKVSETRDIQDSLRAVESAGQLLYRQRVEAAMDSVIQATSDRLSTEVI